MLPRRPLLVALGLATSATLFAACSSSSPSASSLIQDSKSAVSNATALHYVDVTTIGSQSQSITGSVSATQADVTVVINKAPQLEVRLVGTTLYVTTTSASVLSGNLGLSATQAAQLTGKWISVSPGDAPYSKLLTAVSINSEVDPFYPSTSGAKVLPTKTIRGIETTPLQETTSSSSVAKDSTIFLNTKGLLPVGATVIAKSKTVTQTQEAVFQRWNQAFSVSAPTSATALSSIPAA